MRYLSAACRPYPVSTKPPAQQMSRLWQGGPPQPGQPHSRAGRSPTAPGRSIDPAAGQAGHGGVMAADQAGPPPLGRAVMVPARGAQHISAPCFVKGHRQPGFGGGRRPPSAQWRASPAFGGPRGLRTPRSVAGADGTGGAGCLRTGLCCWGADDELKSGMAHRCLGGRGGRHGDASLPLQGRGGARHRLVPGQG